MGKKYVVEIGRLERLYKAYVNGNGKPNITWLAPEVDLTPYTEPDLEQVRKEAYEQGQEDLRKSCVPKDEEAYGIGYNEGFQCGLDLAWDAAKKIALMDTETSENVTGYFGLFRIMENLTPMQAIEKIRQYEQEKEEIKVGDEVGYYGVADEHGNVCYSGVVLEIREDDYLVMEKTGKTYALKKNLAQGKTGRHFHEIATILENMRGEQDG